MFSPLTGVLFGIGAIQEKAQCRLMQPRRDAIGTRPTLPITNVGAVECRLLGAAAVVNPGGDAAGWRFFLYPAADFGFVEARPQAPWTALDCFLSSGRSHCPLLASALSAPRPSHDEDTRPSTSQCRRPIGPCR